MATEETTTRVRRRNRPTEQSAEEVVRDAVAALPPTKEKKKRIRTKRSSTEMKMESITSSVRADGSPRQGQGPRDKREDEGLVLRLEQAILSGDTKLNACQYVGISQECLYRWMREGKAAPEGTLARKIYERILKAEATAVHRNVMVINKAAGRHWQASAWFLERRRPDDWGRKDRMAIGGDAKGVPIAVVGEKVLKDEELLTSMQAILKRAQERREQEAELGSEPTEES